MQLSLLGKFLVSRETDSLKNILGWFLKPSWAEEKGLKAAELVGDCGELRKSNFDGLQSQFRNFF